jgi:hypothetical protein
MKELTFLFTVLMMGFSSQMIGQEAMTRSLSKTQATSTTKVGAFGETLVINEGQHTPTSKKGTVKQADIVETETKTAPPVSKAIIFHGAKEITEESGFYIQLHIAGEPLEKTHTLFQEFGNLKVKEIDDSMFCYLIGDFTTEDTAQKFLKSIILTRYPKATILEFKDGKKIN